MDNALVPIRLRPILRTLPALIRDPFDVYKGVEFMHGVIDTPVLKLAFAQMLVGVPAAERAHLEALTRQKIDYQALARLPEDTFGGAFSRFMRNADFDPEFHAEVYPPCVDGLERNWVYARFARLHDMHHVMLGVGLSPQEEIALQLFLFFNTRDPVATGFAGGLPYFAARYGQLGWTYAETKRLVKAAVRLPNLFRFPYEEIMHEKLVDVRARVGLPAGGYAA